MSAQVRWMGILNEARPLRAEGWCPNSNGLRFSLPGPNFVRIHQSIRVTPVDGGGVKRRRWPRRPSVCSRSRCLRCDHPQRVADLWLQRPPFAGLVSSANF